MAGSRASTARSAFPSFAINTKVDNAAFQYPDLPLPARDIFVDLSLTNPGGSADSTVVKLDASISASAPTRSMPGW